jgi:hypothetical protein
VDSNPSGAGGRVDTQVTTTQPQKRGLDLLPGSWKCAFLLGPWILLVGGIALVVASFISGNRSSFGTTCLTLGVAAAVAGALLPRASGHFSVAGAEANVYGVDDAIRAIADIANAAVPDTDPEKEEKVKSYVSAAAGILSTSPDQIAVDSRPEAVRVEGLEIPVQELGTTRSAPVSLTDLVNEVFGAK